MKENKMEILHAINALTLSVCPDEATKWRREQDWLVDEKGRKAQLRPIEWCSRVLRHLGYTEETIISNIIYILENQRNEQQAEFPKSP